MRVMNVTSTGKWGKEKEVVLDLISRSYNPETKKIVSMTFRAIRDNEQQIIVLNISEIENIARSIAE